MKTTTIAICFLTLLLVGCGGVSGEINVTEGEKSIKGTFTARLQVSKK